MDNSKLKKLILFTLTLSGISHITLANDRINPSSFLDRNNQKFCSDIVGSYVNDNTYIFDSSYKDTEIVKRLISLEDETDLQKSKKVFTPQINKVDANQNLYGYADKSIRMNLFFNLRLLHNDKGVKYTLINRNTNKTEVAITPVNPGGNIEFSIPIEFNYTPIINSNTAFHAAPRVNSLNKKNSYSLLISGLYYHKHPVSLRYDINPYIENLKFHPAGQKCNNGQYYQCNSPIQANPYTIPRIPPWSAYDPFITGYADYFGYYGVVGMDVLSSGVQMKTDLEETPDLRNAGCGFTSHKEDGYKNHNSRGDLKSDSEGGPKGPGFYGFNNMVFNFTLSATIDLFMPSVTSVISIQKTAYTLDGDSSQLSQHIEIIK